MTESQFNAGFIALLRKFEARLETPIIPGGLTGWLRSVSESAQTVQHQIDKLAKSHTEIYDAILKMIQIRKHQSAITTWCMESFSGDHSRGD